LKPAIIAAPLLALCTLSVPAQQTHRRAPAASTPPAAATAPAVPEAPALPPGVPPANGKVETAFALRYIDIKPGDGPVAEPGLFLTVHYTGWLASDGTKFDSSVDRAEPFIFRLGGDPVIPGWVYGFQGMHVGGKRRLFIPYQLAYGERGRPPVIQPKSDLIFDVELLAAGPTRPEPPQPPASSQPPAEPSQPPATPPSGQQTPPSGQPSTPPPPQ
jgi:peptidylprolyl isomerase